MSLSYLYEKCFLSGGIQNLTPKDAYYFLKQGDAILLDVREGYLTGYKKFDVPEVIFLPLSELNHRYKELPTQKPLIVADSTGLRSKEAVLYLSLQGLQNVVNLAGGIVEWERDGLPLIVDITEQLSGSCMCQLRPRNKRIKS